MKTVKLTFRYGQWFYPGNIDGKPQKVWLNNFVSNGKKLSSVLKNGPLEIQYHGVPNNKDSNKLHFSHFCHERETFKYKREKPQKNTTNDRNSLLHGVKSKMGRSPYNFVPLPSLPKPSPDASIDFSTFQKSKHSGYLDYSIENLGPIHTGDTQHLFTRIAKKPAIHGSTSRGLVRALLESIAFSNFVNFNDTAIYRRLKGKGNTSFFKNKKTGWLKYSQESNSFFISEVRGTKESNPKDKIQNNEVSENDSYAILKIAGIGTNKETSKYNQAKVKFPYPKENEKKWPVNQNIIDNYKKDEDREFKLIYDGKNWSSLITKKPVTSRDIGFPVFFESDNKQILHFGHCINYRIPMGRVSDALPEKFKTSTSPDLVQCLFGDDVDLNGTSIQRAGKVYFEDAFIDNKQPTFKKKILQILSRPRVTFEKNYLEQNGANQSRWTQGTKQIRGYKHYQHIITDAWEKNTIGEREYQKLEKYSKEACEKITGGATSSFARNEQKALKSLTEIDPNLAETLFDAINRDEKSQFKAVEVLESKHIFSGRVRFDNLSNTELGALLLAFNLPETMAYKLGMGKPLGLGSTIVKMDKLTLIDRKKRYTSLFDNNGKWNLGEVDTSEKAKIQKDAENDFSDFLFSKNDHNKIWELPHMKDLKTMLTYDDNIQASKTWLEKTRYPTLKPNEFKSQKPLLNPTNFRDA